MGVHVAVGSWVAVETGIAVHVGEVTGVHVGDDTGVHVAVAGGVVGSDAIAVSVALTPDWIMSVMPCAVAVSAGMSGVAVCVGARVMGIGVALLVADAAVGEFVGGCAASVA